MVKDSNRPRRVAELIKRELAAIIPRELDDHFAHKITLTGAEVSPDLSSARIYFSLLAGSAEAVPAAAALNHAAAFLRRALGKRVGLRRGAPELRFVFDESLERGDHMDRLIERALTEDRGHKGD
ncbi:MAG: ribosome-binding factor A [Candidatus Muproteobacteria bacterium RIFCSPHIGHO2_01_FULL_65_16]|uniref:Ribosome-binding factor A n=3 Tax=Candidatus Muproteobacteria TaxID=1817795 RepID=A0A1F6TEU7_9PROT|nr:MAG: ribosome-binding factor A [Candidatus Muproteobacteria bacterium RBG_16_65_31]OGI44505.1 MAG: ribosome-binding factor A [Candidatus Muproteobacteria bacterium RIFCSPHIGHO2_01_FULL_65_16]OGI52160.1 MAG: ribosome-binding factor A [Candidatus Muproteobacteria bacterium RIFCSPHIGHO2_02_FULL_65_16]